MCMYCNMDGVLYVEAWIEVVKDLISLHLHKEIICV